MNMKKVLSVMVCFAVFSCSVLTGCGKYTQCEACGKMLDIFFDKNAVNYFNRTYEEAEAELGMEFVSGVEQLDKIGRIDLPHSYIFYPATYKCNIDKTCTTIGGFSFLAYFDSINERTEAEDVNEFIDCFTNQMRKKCRDDVIISEGGGNSGYYCSYEVDGVRMIVRSIGDWRIEYMEINVNMPEYFANADYHFIDRRS